MILINKSLGYNASAAFWAAYGTCEAIIFSGKAWIHLTGSTLKVSELLGTIGKVTFRRQAAIACLVGYIAYKVIDKILDQTPLSNHYHARRVISALAGIACGILVSTACTHVAFTLIKLASIAVPLILYYIPSEPKVYVFN